MIKFPFVRFKFYRFMRTTEIMCKRYPSSSFSPLVYFFFHKFMLCKQFLLHIHHHLYFYVYIWRVSSETSEPKNKRIKSILFLFLFKPRFFPFFYAGSIFRFGQEKKNKFILKIQSLGELNVRDQKREKKN